MPGDLQPLAQQFPIVDADGKPTLYFIKWAQQKQIDISDGITAVQAQALIDDWAAARDIIAGAGLTGGGDLSVDVTLTVGAGTGINVSADAVALADTAVTPDTYGDATNVPQITIDAQGRITSAVDVPITGGGGGSGGGAWTVVNTSGAPIASGATWEQSVDGNIADLVVTGLGSYSEILVIARLVTKSVSGTIDGRLSVDGGSTYPSSYVIVAGAGTESGSAGFSLHGTNATAARSGFGWVRDNVVSSPKAINTSVDANNRLFTESALVNALRLFPSGGGNFTGGAIYVLVLDPAGGVTAEDVTFTPAGGIAATDVQAAIEEVDTEKFAKTGGTITGATTITGTGAGDLFSVTRSDGAKTFSLDFSGAIGNFDINATTNWLSNSGMFLITTNRTDATQKDLRLGVPHYTNSEQPFLFGLMSSTSAENVIQLGGGTALGNAATKIDFLTAANNTTVTGTKRGGITSSGDLTWGSGSDIIVDSDRLQHLRVYTVATLPAAGTAGRRAAVSDATAPTYLGALTGGGAVSCPVYDNGSAWVSA